MPTAGFLDDKIYAETRIAGLRRRGVSRRGIEARLLAKGVDRETIDAVLVDGQQAEENAARLFARRKRIGPYGRDTDRINRRDKDLAAMCRNGFSFELARKIIDGDREEQFD